MFWKSKEVESLPQEVLEILDDIKNYVGNPKMFSQCDVLTLMEGILYNKSGKEYILAHERSVHSANDLSFYVDGRKIFTVDLFDKRRRVIWSVYNEAFNYLKIKEKDREENDEHAIAVQPEDDVREIIKDVMEFLSGGTVSPITNTLKREGIYLNVYQESVDVTVVDLATKESNDNSILHVHLSEQEQEVLKSFYFKAREEILEREKQKESEMALNTINTIMLQAKK